MDIWYINLDRATDRRRFMELQGRALGLDLKRSRAVEPGDVDPATLARLSTTWERPMRPAEVAIFLSHLTLWRRAVDSHEGLVVLEDDAVLSSAFAHVVGSLPGGFDLINLEDVGRRKFFRRRRPVDCEGFVVSSLVRDRSGAGGYWLSPGGGRRLTALAEGRAALADAFMYGMAGLTIGQVEPAPVKQVHLLAEDGLDVGLTTVSTSNPADVARPRARGGVYAGRRLRTQLSMAGVQLRRLIDVDFRLPRLDRAAFEAVLPVPGLDGNGKR